jgi:hypothetical protein
MRTILLILILAVVALIAAIATGYLDIAQTREARAPGVEASNGVIRAREGQAPAFDVQTGSVEVGTREANVAVPKVEVKRESKGLNVPTVEIRPPEESQQNAAR